MPEESKQGGGILGMLPGIGAAIGTVGGWLGIGEKRQDRRQLEQQGKLSQQAADINYANQMKMWENTNYSAQVEQLKKAGLNPALLYGKGGGGGTTVGGTVGGGQASNAASAMQASTGAGQQMAMLPAQVELIKAQTENVKADTASKMVDPALKGAQQGEIEGRTAGIKFQNELNQLIGADDMAERYRWASDKIALESQKTNAEYEQWKAANFGEMTFDDPSAPGAKAMRAGMEKATADLKQARLNNDATAAGNVVKEFEARLASEGIHPHSPWWTKLITDMLQKVGVIDVAKQMLK